MTNEEAPPPRTVRKSLRIISHHHLKGDDETDGINKTNENLQAVNVHNLSGFSNTKIIDINEPYYSMLFSFDSFIPSVL